MLDQGSSNNVLIFLFGEPYERSANFLMRTFGDKIFNNADKVCHLSLNDATEAQILKVLKTIRLKEGLSASDMSDDQLKFIKDQSNRDLRCAITNMQFHAAGKTVVCK